MSENLFNDPRKYLVGTSLSDDYIGEKPNNH